MHKTFLAAAILLAWSADSFAAGPTTATFITKEDVQKVLEAARGGGTMRVIDLGNYQVAVAIDHRDPPPPPGSPPSATATPVDRAQICDSTQMPPNAGSGLSGMIAHSATSETYIVTAGGGTVLTGGQIVNGARSTPASDVTQLQSPSCVGLAYGNVNRHVMKVGDIVVIPPGVPHGWTDLSPSGVTYLVVRPDPTKVLRQGYVIPALK